ncbi:hypothetical protein B0H13DRAFT_1900626 [Mycena leptocephala]|nr:hypothetical protein B0H13DRAFT_1900626 [Mycena leptocephala]
MATPKISHKRQTSSEKRTKKRARAQAQIQTSHRYRNGDAAPKVQCDVFWAKTKKSTDPHERGLVWKLRASRSREKMKLRRFFGPAATIKTRCTHRVPILSNAAYHLGPNPVKPLRLSLPDNDTLFIPLEATRAPPHWPLRIRDEQAGHKSVLGALREGGKEPLDRVVHAHSAMLIDLALSLTGSQLITSVLPTLTRTSAPDFTTASAARVGLQRVQSRWRGGL